MSPIFLVLRFRTVVVILFACYLKNAGSVSWRSCFSWDDTRARVGVLIHLCLCLLSVIFLASFHSPEVVFEQLSVIYAFPRYDSSLVSTYISAYKCTSVGQWKLCYETISWCYDIISWCNDIISWCYDIISWCNNIISWCYDIISWCYDIISMVNAKKRIFNERSKRKVEKNEKCSFGRNEKDQLLNLACVFTRWNQRTLLNPFIPAQSNFVQ